MWKRMTGSRNVRTAVAIAAVVSAFVLISDLLLLPRYESGHGQGFLSHLNGASMLLALPGFIVAAETGVRQGHHTTAGAWWFILVANCFIWIVAIAFLTWLWQGAARKVRRWRHGKKPDEAPKVNLLRRRVILAGVGVLATGGVGHALAGAPRRYEVTRRTLSIRGLPAGLEGLRLVQVTDVHHGPWIPLSHVRKVVRTVNALEADLVVLTGDYVHRSAQYIEPVVSVFGELRAKIGVLGVLGNHDWWESAPSTRDAFARAGIPLIDNARRFVTPDRHLAADATEGLCVAGVGDYYEDEQRFDDALGGVPDAVPRLLLSHNPDVAEDRRFVNSGHRVDVMLSGHTHGGQIYIPGLGTPIVPSRYGQKYARGLVQGPVCEVFICRGVGHTVLPVRIGVPPEIAVLTLVRR